MAELEHLSRWGFEHAGDVLDSQENNDQEGRDLKLAVQQTLP